LRKAVSGATLAFILMSVLALTSNVQITKAEAAEVIPIKHKGFIDPLMSWYTVVGVLLNNGSSFVTDIKVRCIFRDAEGRLITVEEKTLYRGSLFDKLYLPPGWTSPFKVTVTDTELSKQISSYEISVLYSKVADPLKAHSLALEEVSLSLALRSEFFGYEKWRVAGIIRNLDIHNVTRTQVMAILLDGQGFPLGFGGDSFFDTQPGTIAPGDIGFFGIDIYVPIYSNVSSVQLMMEADQAFGHFPTLPFTSKFIIKWGTETFPIKVFSNSTVGNLTFDQPLRKILFHVAGTSGTMGFCNITIPKKLLWCETPMDWVINIDGNTISYEATETETETHIYFTYSHSIKTIEIIGTHVIPEYPSILTLLLLFTASSIAAMLSKKREKQKFP